MTIALIKILSVVAAILMIIIVLKAIGISSIDEFFDIHFYDDDEYDAKEYWRNHIESHCVKPDKKKARDRK